jgi:hypothetical protein
MGITRIALVFVGKITGFRLAPYLVEQVRPVGWQPNAQLQKVIDQKLQESGTLRTAVEKAKKWAEQRWGPSGF